MKPSVHPPKLLKGIFPGRIWKIPVKEKTIFLTFDDGPLPYLTPWILSELEKYGAKGTFFCVGDNVRKYPDIYKEILNSNHKTGNHTFNHLDGWKTKTADYLDNIKKSRNYIDSGLFRPPHGRLKPAQARALVNDFKIIMWDVLSRDFDKEITVEECLENVLTYTKPGSVVVFHDNFKAEHKLRFVLPIFLKHFSNLGYEFKTIPDNLKKRHFSK
jgi:peptidoglycan-N-acetylglucosamine deacetylase